MKHLLLILMISFPGLNLFAQDIILTFNAHGAATTIDSIVAVNKVTGQSMKVTSTNTLDLTSLVTSINLIEKGTAKNIVYPNPFREKAVVQYFSKKRDNLNVTLTNPLGQVVDTKNYAVMRGTHKFEISGNSAGLCLVRIKGASGTVLLKAMCLQDNRGRSQINYSGISSESVREKSAVAEEGQLIHFRAYSDKYITVIADSPTESKTYDVEFMDCTDEDGKSYKVVHIGEQWWMAENLAYLPSVNSPEEVSDSFARNYVYGYEGNSVSEAKATSNFSTYGVLYNWPAAMNGDTASITNPSGVQGICPAGWHLPSEEEWFQLAQYVSDQNGGVEAGYMKLAQYWEKAGTHLKSTNGWENNGNGTDSYGFSAIPGGFFTPENSVFKEINNSGYWWDATNSDPINSLKSARFVSLGSANWLYIFSYRADTGMSVRCVKN